MVRTKTSAIQFLPSHFVQRTRKNHLKFGEPDTKEETSFILTMYSTASYWQWIKYTMVPPSILVWVSLRLSEKSSDCSASLLVMNQKSNNCWINPWVFTADTVTWTS